MWNNFICYKITNLDKLVKPQVSEAVALPQIYADLIQHKGLFKYYITHFLTVLDVHPPSVTVFLALIENR